MNLLTGFSSSPRQHITITLADGSFATLQLEFCSLQRGWFYNLFHADFELRGQRLGVGGNILRQFVGQIPFGLSVLSADGKDPRTVSDFSNRAVVILLLEGEDIQLIESTNYTRE